MNKWGLISCLLAPVAFAYDFYGRFILAKTLYATNDCMRCGICRHNCPVNAVSYKGNHPYWHLNCESCMRCVNACPQDAIQVGHLSIILTVMICLLLLYPLNSIWVKALGILLLPLPVQIIIYNSQHRLLKFKPIANLVKYTSLTFYKFWGRYKELLKKFKEVK